MYNFGERLRQIRKENNLTQKQFATRVGITERGVQRYEAGERKPTFDVIVSILDNVNVDANYLLGRTDTPRSG